MKENNFVHESFSTRYRSVMSYKHVGTAGDLVRFGCSLKVECTHCGAARLKRAASPGD